MIQLIIIVFNLIFSPTEEYFHFIYKAENCILLYKYEEASKDYETAFSFEEMPFLKDVHNALICSIKCNDTTRIKLFVSQFSKFNLSK